MSHVRYNPSGVPEPTSNLFSHAVEVAPGCRPLFVSGQVGVRPDGSISPVFEEQVEQVMANLRAILAAADMDFGDVVKTTGYCLRQQDIVTYAAIRNRHFPAGPPAATGIVVAGLASPDWLVEVEAVAFKAV